MVHTIRMRGYNNDRLDVLQTSLLFRSCHHHRLGTRTKYGKCERSYRYDAVRTKISRWIKMRINSIDSWTGYLLDRRTDRKLVTGSFTTNSAVSGIFEKARKKDRLQSSFKKFKFTVKNRVMKCLL